MESPEIKWEQYSHQHGPSEWRAMVGKWAVGSVSLPGASAVANHLHITLIADCRASSHGWAATPRKTKPVSGLNGRWRIGFKT